MRRECPPHGRGLFGIGVQLAQDGALVAGGLGKERMGGVWGLALTLAHGCRASALHLHGGLGALTGETSNRFHTRDFASWGFPPECPSSVKRFHAWRPFSGFCLEFVTKCEKNRAPF